MCKVSSHAIDRCLQRWSVKDRKVAEHEIRISYDRGEVLGDWMSVESKNKMNLMLDKATKRVLVVDSDNKVVVTVYNVKKPPLALNMFDDIVKIHKRRINSIQRKCKTVTKQLESERDDLHSEWTKISSDIDKLEKRLAKLKIARQHVEGVLENYERDIVKLNDEKKSTMKSLANYYAFAEVR